MMQVTIMKCKIICASIGVGSDLSDGTYTAGARDSQFDDWDEEW